ncbi:hypothetical protein OQA88_8614 [Cercophora sp. LCS_1]
MPFQPPPSRTKAALDSEKESSSSADNICVVQERPHMTWRSYVWDTLDKSKAERHFLFKLDIVVTPLSALAAFITALDQINIHSAFVSGMREDLGLYGKELNYMMTAWTVGYIVGQIPSNVVLTRIRPSIWLPACQLIWSVLTFLLAKAHTPVHFYVLRFLIGLFESSCHPGILYLLGSWYRSDELGKRAAVHQAAGFIGQMSSGYLMAAVHSSTGPEGRAGLKSWQWLFIVDGIISLPVALAGFALLPDTPDRTRVFYLSTDELAMAQRRMELEGRTTARAPWTLAKAKRIVRSWHLWLPTAIMVLFYNGAAGAMQPTFALWLKSEGYSVRDVNLFPTITVAVGVISALVSAWVSDVACRGARWPAILVMTGISIVTYAVLAVGDGVAPEWKWACYIGMGLGGGIGPLALAWAAEVTGDDNEERAIVVSAMSQFSLVVYSWLPILVWPVTDAPRYAKGFITSLVMWVLLIGVVFWLRFMHKRELAGRKAVDRV